MSTLVETYKSEIAPSLKDELDIKNPMAIPKLSKIVISMGLGRAIQEKKRLESAVRDLEMISGQKPVICRAKKSVSNFKLRKGYEIGCMVTLRGRRMYEFVERFVNVAVPRTRDFRGLSTTSFDGRGNYTIGIAEQTIFPEVDVDRVDFVQGMNITFVTTAETDAHARALLKMLGMPFRRTDSENN